MTNHEARDVVRRAEYQFAYQLGEGATPSSLYVSQTVGPTPDLSGESEGRHNLYGLGLRISRLYDSCATNGDLRTAHDVVDSVTWGDDGEKLLEWYSVGEAPDLVPLQEHFLGYAAVLRHVWLDEGVRISEVIIAKHFRDRPARYNGVLMALLRPIAEDALAAGHDVEAPFMVLHDHPSRAQLRAKRDLGFGGTETSLTTTIGDVLAAGVFLGPNVSPPDP